MEERDIETIVESTVALTDVVNRLNYLEDECLRVHYLVHKAVESLDLAILALSAFVEMSADERVIQALGLSQEQ